MNENNGTNPTTKKRKIPKIHKAIGLSVVLFSAFVLTVAGMELREEDREVEEQSPAEVDTSLPISEIHVVPNWTEDIFHNVKDGDIDDLLATVGRPSYIFDYNHSVKSARWGSIVPDYDSPNPWGTVTVRFNEESREILSKEFSGSTGGEDSVIPLELEDFFSIVEFLHPSWVWTQEIFENVEVATVYYSLSNSSEEFLYGDYFEEILKKVGEPTGIFEPSAYDDRRVVVAIWEYREFGIEIQFDEETNMIISKDVFYPFFVSNGEDN